MKFYYHGNYCGPGWSGGKWQPSIPYGQGPKAIDEFDETCRVHDHAYSSQGAIPTKQADMNFAKSNWGKGLKRSAAAIAVGAQGFVKKTMPPTSYYYRDKNNRLVKAENVPMDNPFQDIPEKGKENISPAISTITEKNKMGASSQSGAVTSRFNYSVNGQKFSASRAQTYGSSKQYENGNFAGDTDVKVLYLQIGTPALELFYSVFRAMVLALCHKHGIHFKDWNAVNTLEGSFVLYVRNKLNATNEPSAVHGFASLETWNQIATSWGNTLINLGYLDNANNYDFYKIEFILAIDSAPSHIEAQLYTEFLEINIQQHLSIRVQNQTSSDGDSSSTDLLNVNPLLCKTFFINGHSAITNVQDFGGVGTGSSPFLPDRSSGYSNYGVEGSSGANTLKKLPQSNVFQRVLKTVKPVHVNPGQMIQRSISKHQSNSLNHWFSGLGGIGPSLLFVLPTEYACNMIIAFEKSMNTRGVEEQGILVGNQWEWFISSYITKKNLKPTNKIVDDV